MFNSFVVGTCVVLAFLNAVSCLYLKDTNGILFSILLMQLAQFNKKEI